MRVPAKKNINWDLKKKRFQLKERIRRWWNRLIRRWIIRSCISDKERGVVKAISLKGRYKITSDGWGYDNDPIYAHKFIAMRYGLDMNISNTGDTSMYSITLKKRQ